MKDKIYKLINYIALSISLICIVYAAIKIGWWWISLLIISNVYYAVYNKYLKKK